ncbi:hypothetical protein J6590_068088 [Homalodisca vitripennis]|nr:hypothetical protein J6590_068088 [Homalodisca vitripennis]
MNISKKPMTRIAHVFLGSASSNGGCGRKVWNVYGPNLVTITANARVRNEYTAMRNSTATTTAGCQSQNINSAVPGPGERQGQLQTLPPFP